ncbi:MAG: hypothetical protein KatS3mg124_2336 [Porticoccaceae bacterium]|nr:MAG: hypothetical protein KatS3mg124_2336 [Porticoccaceae bacterium]
MTALFAWLFLALGVSFFCSLAEAVLLSVTWGHIGALRLSGQQATAHRLEALKRDVEAPLAVILTLNTVAHTMGAAGVGAEATRLFGHAALGATSAILTLLVLVLSEILPKTLGAAHWRRLAGPVAAVLAALVVAARPLVWLLARFTRSIAAQARQKHTSREEVLALLQLARREEVLDEREARLVEHVLMLRELRVEEIMTPASMIQRLPESLRVGEFLACHGDVQFSRIPLYRDDPDRLTGFVLRSELLMAAAHGQTDLPLAHFRRELLAVPDKLGVLAAFDRFLRAGVHIMAVYDEYGSLRGLVTLEDVIETLMGLEIVDESDREPDLQAAARRRWLDRARELGVSLDELDSWSQGGSAQLTRAVSRRSRSNRRRRAGPGAGSARAARIRLRISWRGRSGQAASSSPRAASPSARSRSHHWSTTRKWWRKRRASASRAARAASRAGRSSSSARRRAR